MTIVRKSSEEPHEWNAAWDALAKLNEAIDMAMPRLRAGASEKEKLEHQEFVCQIEAHFEEERDAFLNFLIQKRVYENEEIT